jgi:predicted type I restriction-modification enzyme, subunit S
MRKMKDSGIPWVGEIPKNWEIKRLKYVMDNYDYERIPVDAVKRSQVGEKLYDYYGASGVIDKIDGYTSEGERILIGEDGANLLLRNLPVIYIANGKYWVNNHAHILKPKGNGNLHFFAKQMECIDYTKYITGSAQPKLSRSNLELVRLVVPPISEQYRIADFLDSKCSKIDSIRENVEAEIEALKQYKCSIITEAVTKGLDKNVEMKDSGIPWIGEIPKEWVICKVKNVVSHIGSGTTPTSGKIEFYENGTVNWIQSGDLYETNKINETNKKVSESAIKLFPALHIYKAKFIVIAMYGASVGNIAISNIDACVNQACCCIKTNEFNNLKYMFYWLFSCKNDFLKITDGGGQPNISQTKIKNQYYLKPPIEEQHRIVDFLDTKCARIDSIIQKKQELLANLDTYKKSLIYEYVTGKKEVPAV